VLVHRQTEFLPPERIGHPAKMHGILPWDFAHWWESRNRQEKGRQHALSEISPERDTGAPISVFPPESALELVPTSALSSAPVNLIPKPRSPIRRHAHRRRKLFLHRPSLPSSLTRLLELTVPLRVDRCLAARQHVQPPVSRHLAVVLVRLPVPQLPLLILSGFPSGFFCLDVLLHELRVDLAGLGLLLIR
jgi:hypothetical protein